MCLGLDKIIESIDALAYNNNWFQGLAGHWNARAHDSRHRFCKEVALYFMAMDEVPDYNAQEVVKASESMSLGHVADSFYIHAKRLEEMRKTSSVESASGGGGNSEQIIE